jgi:hypothetical protein
MKQRKIMGVMGFVLALLLLAGCSGKQAEIDMKTMDPNSSVKKVNFSIEPVDSTGILVTELLKQGKVTIRKGIFGEILEGEYSPGRIVWYGITVQKRDGKEFFTQYILSPENGKVTWTILIDGYPDDSAVTMSLSSMVEYAYDAFGKEFLIDQGDFSNKPEYRHEFIMKKGTRIAELKKVDLRDFLRTIKTWNPLTTEKGEILTPLRKEHLQKIAEINPQYAEWEKRLASNHTSVFIANPISIGVYNALESIRTEVNINNGGVPSIGWDFRSQFSNRRMNGLTHVAFEAMKKGSLSH